ncbi:MAG: hypothetical protein ACYTHM_07335, partial [Planctomycetota bacterium]
ALNPNIGTIAQAPPYPPHLWPFIEPCGGPCTASAELFDPFGFGCNPTLPFWNVDQTGQYSPTTDGQGNVTSPPGYLTGVYWHTGTGLLDGSVLIAGGMDLLLGTPFCTGSCSIYNP